MLISSPSPPSGFACLVYLRSCGGFSCSNFTCWRSLSTQFCLYYLVDEEEVFFFFFFLSVFSLFQTELLRAHVIPQCELDRNLSLWREVDLLLSRTWPPDKHLLTCAGQKRCSFGQEPSVTAGTMLLAFSCDLYCHLGVSVIYEPAKWHSGSAVSRCRWKEGSSPCYLCWQQSPSRHLVSYKQWLSEICSQFLRLL